MTVLATISDLKACILDHKSAGMRVAFVPTMGALHEGHVSLIQAAKAPNTMVVASIFVNPTQFNSASDLEHYPRMEQSDVVLLEKAGCDIVFIPSVSEMYPVASKGHWDYGLLTSTLEGKFRPGHFDGVLTIVKRLFEAVTPDVAFFGEKDFQQLAHIKRLAREEFPQIEIVGCPTIREADGLAMSSRNLRLSEDQRKTARKISVILEDMKEKRADFSPSELEAYGRSLFEVTSDIRLEYLEIVDKNTFGPVVDWSSDFDPIILVAAYVGEVRLIDNLSW